MSTQTDFAKVAHRVTSENGGGAASAGDTSSSRSALRDPATWAGWVGFAALLLFVSGSLDFFQGLIAIVRNHYYTLDPNQIIVVDLTAWGWIALFWGSIVALAGVGLLWRSEIARWLAVVVTSLGIVLELGFAGSSQFTLWALTVIAMNVLVLYALVVRWR